MLNDKIKKKIKKHKKWLESTCQTYNIEYKTKIIS